MRAFISFSINDYDQYILTLLASELKNRGFAITQSNDFNTEMSSLTKVNINKAQLFIGLITEGSLERDRVLTEWRLANIASIPTFLLIEKTVPVSPDFKFQYIIFDRDNPQYAINDLNNKINPIKQKQNQDSNAWALILGGAALLVIIGLLTKKDK